MSLSRTIEFNGGPNVNREPDQPPAVLAPGSYGDVTIKSRSGLSLSTGTYYFESISIEPQATLQLDTSAGPIVAFVRNGFDFKGTFQHSGAASDVFFGILGTGTVSLEAALNGTLVVPNATLRFAPANKTFAGSFFAKSIELEPDLTVRHVPFAHWGMVLLPTPFIECVNQFDSTHFNAVVGYDNQLGIPVSVPAGANNFFDPPNANPPTDFQPGIHHDAAVVPFTPPSLTWSVGGRTAVASSASPRCTLEQLADATPPGPDLIGEGAGRASAAARAGLTRNFGSQGMSTGALPPIFGVSQAAAASSGSSTNGVGTTQQALTATGPSFVVTITQMTIGSDALCWGGDPFVQVFVNGIQIGGNQTIATDCGGTSACATTYFPDIAFTASNVSPNDATATVRLVLVDRDSDFCGGGNDTVVDSTFEVNNLTGDFGQLAGSGDDGEGWILGFSIQGNGRPRACMTFAADYLDSANPDGSAGQDDFLAGGDLHLAPASNAVAQMTIQKGPVSHTFTGPLDTDGCVPAEFAAPAELWTLPPPGSPDELTLSFRWTSEFCIDPTNAGCIDATAGTRTAGGRFLVRETGQTEPGQFCIVVTQDEEFTDPTGACLVIHGSEGGFSTWGPSGEPPPSVHAHSPVHNEITRISALVSTLFQRESQTEGDLGLRLGLVDRRLGPGTNLVTLVANEDCLLFDGTRDSCASGGTIFIRQDKCCISNDFTDCRDVPATGCDPALGEHLVEGDSFWKYILAHEIGHEVQSRIWGRINNSYGEGAGIPGAPTLCRCDHVTSSNNLHCMQSLELPSAAQVEG
ncbi:MAG: hypothetical protein WBE98_06320, partial [Gammaproteobacteria bacterium]